MPILPHRNMLKTILVRNYSCMYRVSQKKCSHVVENSSTWEHFFWDTVYFRKPSKSTSPTKRNQFDQNQTTKIDPKLGAPRKTAGVRNLPKIDKTGKKKERSRGGRVSGDSDASSDTTADTPETSSRKSANSSIKDLDTVQEEGDN